MTYDPRTSAREKTPFGEFELRPSHLKTTKTRPRKPRPITPEEIHAARLTVCEHATDVDDARDLLGVLGLLEVT